MYIFTHFIMVNNFLNSSYEKMCGLTKNKTTDVFLCFFMEMFIISAEVHYSLSKKRKYFIISFFL